jgi:anti-sigma regulatory factor (Ser/Thr protein kinase)
MPNSRHVNGSYSHSWEYTLHIPHDPRAIGIARGTLRAILTQHGLHPLIELAELLASELLTNAYLHSKGPASLRLRWREGTLRLGVWDTDPRPPEHSQPSGAAKTSDTEGGRGLQLVNRCAAAWGWFPLGEGCLGACGKYVWCELPREALAVAA